MRLVMRIRCHVMGCHLRLAGRFRCASGSLVSTFTFQPGRNELPAPDGLLPRFRSSTGHSSVNQSVNGTDTK